MTLPSCRPMPSLKLPDFQESIDVYVTHKRVYSCTYTSETVYICRIYQWINEQKPLKTLYSPFSCLTNFIGFCSTSVIVEDPQNQAHQWFVGTVEPIMQKKIDIQRKGLSTTDHGGWKRFGPLLITSWQGQGPLWEDKDVIFRCR